MHTPWRSRASSHTQTSHTWSECCRTGRNTRRRYLRDTQDHQRPDPPRTWDDLVPKGDMGALAETIRRTTPRHPFINGYEPAMVNGILAYHSWTTQQHLHLHSASDDAREWHPIGAPALVVYVHEDAATGAHTITDLKPATPLPILELYIPPSQPRPTPPTRDDSPLREHNQPVQKNAEPTTPLQHMPKPPTNHHVPNNYQLPRGGKHTRRVTPTWTLPTGTINWKEFLPGVVAVEAIHLITTEPINLPPDEHLFITIQGTATTEGATLGDDHQMPQARPTQAIWVTATTDVDIAIDPDLEWSAIYYTVESAVGDPKTTNWRQRWTTEME